MAELIIEKHQGVGKIIISNPKKLNAMTLDMWLGIPKALQEFDQDNEIRVIVVEGAGDRSFISGADIAQFDGLRDAQEAQDRYNDAVAGAYGAPIQCSKPVVAAIDGICFGGGLGFAAACDVRLSSSDAIFRMPAARLGLGYDPIGIKRFIDVIGLANTADIFFSARQFNANDAIQMGFVSQVFQKSDFHRQVNQYLQMVSENAPLTMKAAKFAMKQYMEDAANRNMALATQMVVACYESEDYAEGRSAFAQKRVPNFKGR